MPLSTSEKKHLKKLIDAGEPLPEDYHIVLFPECVGGQFQRLYEDAPVGLFRLGIDDFQPVAFSRELIRLTGHADRAAFIADARKGSFYIDPDDRAKLYAELRTRGEVRDYDVRITRQDGTLAWIRMTGRLNPQDGFWEAAAVDVTSEKQAQEQLRKNEERLRLALDAAADGVWDYDALTGVILRSAHMAEILGYQPEELAPTIEAWSKLLHPEDYPRAMAAWEDHLAGRTPAYQSEHRLRAKSGEWRWILDRGRVAARDAQGRPLRATGTHKDIDTQKQAEEQLRQMSEMLDMAPSVIMVHDFDGRFIYANKRTLELHGYSHQELMQLNLHQLDVPESERLIQQHLAELRERGEAVFDVGHFRKDGSVLPLEVYVRTAQWLGQDVLLSVGTDTSERRQAETALRASEAQLRRILENYPDVIYRFDREHRYQYLNKAIEGGYVFPPEWLIGKTPEEAGFPSEECQYWREMGDQVLATKQVLRGVTEVTGPNGPGYLEWCMVPELNEDGDAVSVMSIERDITERRRAEQHLAEVNTQLAQANELLAGMNEELKAANEELAATNEELGAANQELAQAHREIAEAKAYIETLIETANAMVIGLDCQGRVEFCNQAAVDLLGYTREEAIGQNWFALAIPPEEQDGIKRFYTAWQRGAAALPGTYVNAVVTKLGEWRTVEWRNSELVRNGIVVGSVSFGIDVTERKRAEDAMRESEERLRLALQGAKQGLYDLNLKTGIAQVTPEYVTMLGYELAEFDPSIDAWVGLLHPEDQARVSLAYQACVAGQTTDYNLEYRLRMKSGEWKWILSLGKVIEWDAQGRPWRMVGTHTDISASKQAEEQLKVQARVLDQIGDTVTATDLTGRITYVNQAQCRAVGKTKAQLLGRSVDAFGDDPSQGATQREVIRETLAKGEWRGEIVNLSSSGEQVYVDLRTWVITDDSGNPIGMCGAGTDISESRRAQMALRANEEFLRAVVDHSPLGISVRTSTGRLVSYNQAWQRIWAMTSAAIAEDLSRERGELIFDRRDGYLQPWWQQIYDLYHEGGTLFLPEVRTNCTRAGAAEWISQHFYAILDSQGRVDRVVVITQDVTNRKRIEEALREKTEELDRFFNLALDLLCIADTAGYFRRLNPAWETTLGYRVEDLEHCRFADLVHADDQEQTMQVVKELAEGKSVMDFTNRYRCKDGSYRWIEWRSIPYQGKLIYAAARDVTGRINAEEERTRLEAQLRQAQKMEAIGTLAGGIAHDFNNLLFAIMGNAELIQEDLPPDSQASENLARLLAAGKRAKGLVQQILTFSRKSAPGAIQFDLMPVVKEVAKLLTATLPSMIEVRQRFEPLQLLVEADPTELHQVVLNLCTNAAQAMEGQVGILELALRPVVIDADFAARHLALKPGAYVELIISDTGPGIAPDIKERIFEPFFTTKAPGQGTGMGLAVVHGIVTKLGGAVSVYSELGIGSSFQVFLPAVPGEEEAPPAPVKPVPTGSGRVLLVDDEPDIVSVMQQILKSMGYRVTALYSSVEALALFKQDPQRFDLLITDQTMPKLPGSDLAREVLALRPDLPIILCTGFSQSFSPELAASLGIGEYLFKPVLKQDLAAALERIHARNIADGSEGRIVP